MKLFYVIYKKSSANNCKGSNYFVPQVGLEPTPEDLILNQARLPIPPLGHKKVRYLARFSERANRYTKESNQSFRRVT